MCYTMTTLLEQKERTDNKPANHLDNTYDFYDRSSSTFSILSLSPKKKRKSD